MHLIKTLFRPAARFVALGLLLIVPLLGQAVSPGPKEANASPRAESRELADARFELESMLRGLGEKHPNVVAQRLKIAHLEKLEPRKFNFDFPGGPMTTFVHAVSEIDGISFNVISSDQDDLRAAIMPSFSLRNVQLVTLLKVATRLVPHEFVLEPAAEIEPDSVVCILRRRSATPANANGSDFESFQLGPYLVDQSVDEIIDAIRAAWELNPAHTADALRLKYHPATSMLLVSGQIGNRMPSEAIDITRKVLSQLKRTNLKDVNLTPPAAPPDREKK